MSKEINVNIEFLVSGLIPVEGYKIDGFELVTKPIDMELISKLQTNNYYYWPHLLTEVMIKYGDKGQLEYLILKKEKYNFKLKDKDERKNKEQINETITNELIAISNSLEKKLKLLTNFNIVLPIGIAKIINTKGIDKVFVAFKKNNTSAKRLDSYTEKDRELLSLRLSKGVSLENIGKVASRNSRFKRALNLYYDSFLPKDRYVRFLLLFSSLESLFNIFKDKDGKSKNKEYIREIFNYNGKDELLITRAISIGVSKFLFLNEKRSNKIFRKIQDYYKRRSSYVHGNEIKIISNEQEQDLREMVRKVLLMYWIISIHKDDKDAYEIIYFVTRAVKEKLNSNLRMFLVFVEDKNFQESLEELFSIITNDMLK